MENCKIISFRCSDEEYKTICKNADLANLSKSELIRDTLLSSDKLYILQDGAEIASSLFFIRKQLTELPKGICTLIKQNYKYRIDDNFDWWHLEKNIASTIHELSIQEENICQLLDSLTAAITTTKN